MHLFSRSLDMGLNSEGQEGLVPLVARLMSEARSLLKLPENFALKYSIFQHGREIDCPLESLLNNFQGEIKFEKDEEIAAARKMKEASATKQRKGQALLNNEASVVITRLNAKPLALKNIGPKCTLAELRKKFIDASIQEAFPDALDRVKAKQMGALLDSTHFVLCTIDQKGTSQPIQDNMTLKELKEQNLSLMATPHLAAAPEPKAFQGVFFEFHENKSVDTSFQKESIERLSPSGLRKILTSAPPINGISVLIKAVENQLVSIEKRLARTVLISESEKQNLRAKKDDLQGALNALVNYGDKQQLPESDLTISAGSKAFLGARAGGFLGKKWGRESSTTEEILKRVNTFFADRRVKPKSPTHTASDDSSRTASPTHSY